MGSNILLLAGGVIMVAVAFRILWPRPRREPSAKNNWQQRDGSERFGASAIDPTLSEVDVAAGAAVDAVGGSR